MRVVSFFGITDNADTPEEVMILKESSEQVDRANELLRQLPQAPRVRAHFDADIFSGLLQGVYTRLRTR